MNHGTEGGYTCHRCRCDLCRTAANTARRRRRQHPHPKKHGANAYANGCRCRACLDAHLDRLRYGSRPPVEVTDAQLQLRV